MGANDPHSNTHGKIDFRISRQIAGCKREDPPPDRVKPVPVQTLRHSLGIAHSNANNGNQAIADVMALAFFFPLQPGKHTGMQTDNRPFHLEDVQSWIGAQRYLASTVPIQDLPRVTFATLTFTAQKNAVCGKVIGSGCSGDPIFCPVLALVRCIRHLRTDNATPNTPLATCYENGKHAIKPSEVMAALRSSAATLGPALGFLPKDISACSLRVAGAMALLCAHVDTDTIRLIGRWWSDEMLRYLHVQAEPVMQNCSRLMLSGEAFTLLPSQDVPMH